MTREADAAPGRAAEASFPLLRVVDAVRADERRIRAKVEGRRAELAARSGLAGAALADALAEDLVLDAKLRSALIGAGFALPWSVPFVGVWGTIALAVIGAALWQTANEVELVYELAYVYDADLEPDALRLTAFWLVQLANFEDLRARAMSTGVNLTVRKLVQKLIAVGLMRAYGATAHSMMMARALPGARGQPWYVRATEYIGVPVLFWFGWRSTAGVGRRAVAYFRPEAVDLAAPSSPGVPSVSPA